MMLGRAAILCVGRLSEEYLREGCAEYQKRLTRYLKLAVEEVRDRQDFIPLLRALDEEGDEILRRVSSQDHLVALTINGRRVDSIALSQAVERWLEGGRRMVFVIGGSRGLSSRVLARADEHLSFSPMTFPHGLARLMLLEQLYRACRIASGEAYHK